MKQFLYCEGTDGGMDHFLVSTVEDLAPLRGWMSLGCRNADLALRAWLTTAQIGEMHEHRLGICVRLKDADG